MKRYIAIYGAVCGAVIIGSIILGSVVGGGEGSHSGAMWLGYLIMLVALSAIFVAVKRYRDRELGGVIKFGRAFLLGLGISVVASLVYVGVWEVYLAATDHAFIEQYATGVLEAKAAAGLPEAELAALAEDLEKLKLRYADPLFRLPMTFLELFPVGLIVSLVAAAVLRNSRVLPADEPGSDPAGA